jgi:hypothetical protein
MNLETGGNSIRESTKDLYEGSGDEGAPPREAHVTLQAAYRHGVGVCTISHKENTEAALARIL